MINGGILPEAETMKDEVHKEGMMVCVKNVDIQNQQFIGGFSGASINIPYLVLHSLVIDTVSGVMYNVDN